MSFEDYFKMISKKVGFASLRWTRTESEYLLVRQNKLEPLSLSKDSGYMITVIHDGGVGYSSSADFSEQGIDRSFKEAMKWATITAQRAVCDFSALSHQHSTGSYNSPLQTPWNAISLSEKIDTLKTVCENIKDSDLIVDWGASLNYSHIRQRYITNGGGEVEQEISRLMPNVYATAFDNGESQTRTLFGGGLARQAGWELIDECNLLQEGKRVGREAVELLKAQNCPDDCRDLLLMPDQMMLQIHESIGHPLELDRILGDERNYAGTSFVNLDMFGTYRYGTDLLNVSFDPTLPGELASYSVDDEGVQAEKTLLIEKGILKTPLGSLSSQQRANISGVANARSTCWNRPPMDRMANLNIEPGETSFEHMLASVEKGILMEANRSWSIDDSRNKFQFGCEFGRIIENGQLGAVVKNPNYRGISSSFWRSLKAVGDELSREVHGTLYCGKGELNQVIPVGHASPPCLFENVEIFGA